MAGLLRNLITLLLALPRVGRHLSSETLHMRFWVSPLDAGIRNIRLETLDLNEAIAAVEVACAGGTTNTTRQRP